MSYLIFDQTGTSKSGKTKQWHITNNNRDILGYICWFANWRKYTLVGVPPNVVLDEKCLREIANFIETKTKEHYSKDPRQISLVE